MTTVRVMDVGTTPAERAFAEREAKGLVAKPRWEDYPLEVKRHLRDACERPLSVAVGEAS